MTVRAFEQVAWTPSGHPPSPFVLRLRDLWAPPLRGRGQERPHQPGAPGVKRARWRVYVRQRWLQSASIVRQRSVALVEKKRKGDTQARN